MHTPEAFGGFYRGKTVLVTGHTGFKGSWLALWLTDLGARVVGYALEPPSIPSHFETARLGGRIEDVRGDVRDAEALRAVCAKHRPDVVFHLAAQALVRRSYEEPIDTFASNVMGTVNVLDAVVRTESVAATVVISSDKCYRNQEWPWGYRETDSLGGDDPYSASKGCAELAVLTYQNPVVQRRHREHPVPIASARAGNVIGGGDWAPDRLVPDVVRAVNARQDVVLRYPSATRPWQHVLEPLSGYLWLACRLAHEREALAEGWNFGPNGGLPVPVGELVGKLLSRWQPPATRLVVEPAPPGESVLLHLDCSKAAHRLGWRLAWSTDDAVDAIVEWYSHHLDDREQDMAPWSLRQIGQYTAAAAAQGLPWATSPAVSS